MACKGYFFVTLEEAVSLGTLSPKNVSERTSLSHNVVGWSTVLKFLSKIQFIL